MDASKIGGKIHLEYSGVIYVPENGLVSVDARDLPTMRHLGATEVNLTPFTVQTVTPSGQ
jgi:hypothetical protein